MTWRTFWDRYCISVKLKAAWLWLYAHHIQKTMGALMGAALSSDLIAELQGAQGPISSLIGDKWFKGILIAASVLVFIRAKWPSITPPP